MHSLSKFQVPFLGRNGKIDSKIHMGIHGIQKNKSKLVFDECQDNALGKTDFSTNGTGITGQLHQKNEFVPLPFVY